MLNTTINYENIGDEAQHIRNMRAVLSGTPHRFEHEHRVFEYAIALKALRDHDCEEVLEVGGGGSLFAPAISWPSIGMTVTVVDPHNAAQDIAQQSNTVGRPIGFENSRIEEFSSRQKYDAVVCLSTIEHIEDDKAAIKKMTKFVRSEGIFVLTTDFHPSGKPQVEGHLRTYSSESLLDLVPKGFEVVGKYSYPAGTHIYDSYTFASLVMKKKPYKRR